MPFSETDRTILLAVKGVGLAVVQRPEEFGISDLKTLAVEEESTLCSEISRSLGSTCWRNSSLARKALAGAIEAARAHTH
jgi:hypothetical protein